MTVGGCGSATPAYSSAHLVAGSLEPTTPSFCTLEIAELVDECLVINPQSRPSASEAVASLAKAPVVTVGANTYSFLGCVLVNLVRVRAKIMLFGSDLFVSLLL